MSEMNSEEKLLRDIKISVIVPIFNVEEYLAECLKSLQEQDFSDFEAILIDDGSTDKSADIALEYASGDPRFVFLQTDQNLGPGAARNLAISKASGEYLAFLDSDDIIPRHAYTRMYEEAKRHDADIVTGNVMRLRDGKYGTARLFEIVFSKYEHVTDIRRNPVLVYDSISCNKLIRRDYWISKGISYPEGITFEDVPMTFEAYHNTDKVVMIDDIVYLWRVRDAGPDSITQQKNLNIVKDRLNALRIVAGLCEEKVADEKLIREKKYKNLVIDLNVLVNKAIELDDSNLAEAMSMLREYMLEDNLDTEIIFLPAIYKQKYRAILDGNMNKLRELRNFQTDPLSSVRTLRIGSHVIGIFPGSIMPGRIADMKTTLDAELLRQKITSVRKIETSIILSGCAFIRYLPVRNPSDVKMSAWLVDDNRDKVLELQLRQTKTKAPFGMEKRKNSNRVAYRGTGYEIMLNHDTFTNVDAGRYRIMIVWEACRQHREAVVFPVRDEDLVVIRDALETDEGRIKVISTLKQEPAFIIGE